MNEGGERITLDTDLLFEMIPAYLEFFGFGTATVDEFRSLAKDTVLTDAHGERWWDQASHTGAQRPS